MKKFNSNFAQKCDIRVELFNNHATKLLQTNILKDIDKCRKIIYNEAILSHEEILKEGGQNIMFLLRFILKMIAIVVDAIILVIDIIENLHK